MQIDAPNRMRKNMALSTTQSIWRSGGGDTTRTAYCGSGLMAAQFYIPDASETANVLVADGGPALILPAGAVVVSVSVITTGTGSVDLGTTGYTSGTATPAAIANNLSVATAATTSIGSVVTGTASTEMAYVTSRSDTSGNNPAAGIITYFVTDPLVGQQNV
jgi:hypothetical protein